MRLCDGAQMINGQLRDCRASCRMENMDPAKGWNSTVASTVIPDTRTNLCLNLIALYVMNTRLG